MPPPLRCRRSAAAVARCAAAAALPLSMPPPLRRRRSAAAPALRYRRCAATACAAAAAVGGEGGEFTIVRTRVLASKREERDRSDPRGAEFETQQKKQRHIARNPIHFCKRATVSAGTFCDSQNVLAETGTFCEKSEIRQYLAKKSPVSTTLHTTKKSKKTFRSCKPRPNNFI